MIKNKKTIFILILIIILQNLGLFIKNQNTIKQMVRNTESYISASVSLIDDLINLEINEDSEQDDIDSFEKNISLCRYYLLLAESELKGYRVNVNGDLDIMHGYVSEHQEILGTMLEDNIFKTEEKEFLVLLKGELINYSSELKKLDKNLLVLVKDINSCTRSIDNLSYQIPPPAFGYIERYNEFVNK